MAALSSPLPNPHRTRRTIGLVLFLLGMVTGLVLLTVVFLVPPLFEKDPLRSYATMVLAAALAFPAALMYLTVPRLLDRYDPEPAFALIGCLCWGGFAACGFSAVINTLVAAVGEGTLGQGGGELLSTVISAPFVEELFKGLGVAGVFYFLRREFDGVVDGIIYATFTAIGFAAVENVVYYAQAAQESTDVLALTFVLRGVLAPWGHPLYTCMTGIGFGIARESSRPWARFAAPLLGYLGAVMLHMIWNGAAMAAGALGAGGAVLFILSLLLWFFFVAAFLILVIVLVRRRGKIIRAHLQDEVALGTIDRGELELVCSAFGLMKVRMRHGRRGVEFVRATARLALSKWHTARAVAGSTRTVSMDFIGPLRRRIAELRAGLAPKSGSSTKGF